MPVAYMTGYILSYWSALSCLHSLTLNACQEIPVSLKRLPSLRNLTVHLTPQIDNLQDFQYLAQLTKLHISLDEPHNLLSCTVCHLEMFRCAI